MNNSKMNQIFIFIFICYVSFFNKLHIHVIKFVNIVMHCLKRNSEKCDDAEKFITDI